MIDSGIFGNSSALADRLKTHEEASELSDGCKKMKVKVVLTNGSFDLPHVGHVRYLAKARAHGDVLFVGVDSDDKIRARKGDDRPMVPQEERLEILAGLRGVDVLVIKEKDDEKWALIKAVRPDVLIVSETTRKKKPIPQEEIDELKQYCGEIVVLPGQAETSTSARIRNFVLNVGKRIEGAILHAVPGIVADATKDGL